MEEDIARATWKVNGVQLPPLQISVSLQGPLPPGPPPPALFKSEPLNNRGQGEDTFLRHLAEKNSAAQHH